MILFESFMVVKNLVLSTEVMKLKEYFDSERAFVFNVCVFLTKLPDSSPVVFISHAAKEELRTR